MVHLDKDGKELLYSAVAFLISDTIALVLRLAAKSKTKHRFGIDDVYIILTFVVFTVWAGLVIGSKQFMHELKNTY